MYRQSGSDCAYSHVTTETLGRFRTGREQKGTTMRNDHVTLRATAVFDLLAPRCPAVPVRVELRYDTRDPYAVVAAFRTGKAGWVEWVFARDLLADGLIAAAGEGDVRIRPSTDDPEVVVVELSSPSGHAVFEASAQEFADFLDRTYDVGVPGNEHLWVDVDEALTQMISTDLG